MHVDGFPSWEMREDSSRPVLAVLYLRDSLGIEEPDELPRLAPTIAVTEHARTVREQALLAQQWLWWWRATIDPQGHTSTQPLELVTEDDNLQGVALPRHGFDQLRRAVLELGPAADAWANQQHPRHGRAMIVRMGHSRFTVQQIVREVEDELRRPVNPFRLRVEMAPFAEAGLWWIGDSAVLVSESLRADEGAYGEALRPVIARLA